MKHKSTVLLLSGLLVLNLWGCKASAPQASASAPETAPIFTELPQTEAPTEAEIPATEAPIDNTARMTAFRTALERLVSERVLPDGTEVLKDDGFGAMENNEFLIADVDGDGEEELGIFYTTAPMAGMLAQVYGFDSETETMYCELTEFPAIRFYTGGLAAADYSHNHGMGGEHLWPYTLYGYNPAQLSYEGIAHVDSWDADRGDDYNGNPFPAEADTDNAGVVYCITLPGETEPQNMSQSAYDAWVETIYGSAEKMELDYRKLTSENIAAIG